MYELCEPFNTSVNIKNAVEMTQDLIGTPKSFDLPVEVIRDYLQLLNSYGNRVDWKNMTEGELWSELCLCILSSNVPYEMAKSSFFHLREKGLLDYIQMTRTSFEKRIAKELAKPIYLPMKKDGSPRKYRFPNVRAKNIVEARKVIYCNNGFFSLLHCFDSDIKARDFLATHIPGIGLKEASHFLRNIKYSSSLAIIDSHIISFLKEVSLITADIKNGKILNPKTYYRMEMIMQSISARYNLDLSVLDLAIWRYMKDR